MVRHAAPCGIRRGAVAAGRGVVGDRAVDPRGAPRRAAGAGHPTADAAEPLAARRSRGRGGRGHRGRGAAAGRAAADPARWRAARDVVVRRPRGRARSRSTLSVPQHPGLAANGSSTMHDDAWATDSYQGPGPLGKDPEVTTSWYGLEGVRDARVRPGRPARGALRRPHRPGACTCSTPRPCARSRPWTCRTARSRTSSRGRTSAAVPTSTSTRRRARSSRRPTAGCSPSTADGLETHRRGRPQRRGAGRRLPGRAAARLGGQHLVRHPGRPGRAWPVAPATRPRSTWPARSPTRSPPTTPASTWSPPRRWSRWRSTATGSRRSSGRGRTTTAREQKPGQLSAGSGTTPTLLPSGLVAITDNADPQMHVQFYDAVDGSLVCEAAGVRQGRERERQLPGRGGRRERRGREQLRLQGAVDHAARPRDAGRPGPGRRRPGHRRVLGRLALRRGRPDLGGQGLAGHRAGLRLHDPAVLVGRERVVPHRHRRPHRRDRVLGPHRHRHAVQQPLLRGDARRPTARRTSRRSAGWSGSETARALEPAEVVRYVDGVLPQRLQRHELEDRLVGRGQHHRRGRAVAVGARPVDARSRTTGRPAPGRGRSTPASAWSGRCRCSAGGPGTPRSPPRRSCGCRGPRAPVAAAPVPEEAGHRVGAAGLQLTAQDIALDIELVTRPASHRSSLCESVAI